MKLRDQIAAEVEAFMERTGMPPATFGRRALSDPTFVFELREGREIKTSTIDRLREFMASHCPKRVGNESRVAA